MSNTKKMDISIEEEHLLDKVGDKEAKGELLSMSLDYGELSEQVNSPYKINAKIWMTEKEIIPSSKLRSQSAVKKYIYDESDLCQWKVGEKYSRISTAIKSRINSYDQNLPDDNKGSKKNVRMMLKKLANPDDISTYDNNSKSKVYNSLDHSPNRSKILLVPKEAPIEVSLNKSKLSSGFIEANNRNNLATKVPQYASKTFPSKQQISVFSKRKTPTKSNRFPDNQIFLTPAIQAQKASTTPISHQNSKSHPTQKSPSSNSIKTPQNHFNFFKIHANSNKSQPPTKDDSSNSQLLSFILGPNIPNQDLYFDSSNMQQKNGFKLQVLRSSSQTCSSDKVDGNGVGSLHEKAKKINHNRIFISHKPTLSKPSQFENLKITANSSSDNIEDRSQNKLLSRDKLCLIRFVQKKFRLCDGKERNRG